VRNQLAGGSACPTYATALMLTNLPIRPRSLNSTTPVTLANSVSSLPQPTLRPGLILVPRCRTMMDPPGTNWPPKTFTPRPLRLGNRARFWNCLNLSYAPFVTSATTSLTFTS